MIPSGQYEGEPVKGSAQIGETNNGHLQFGIDMQLFDSSNQSLGVMTTLLVFTDKSQVFQYEKLRALGWTGTTPQELIKQFDQLVNRVPCRVTEPEKYQDPTGTWKMGTSKLEILTGTGQVKMSKPLTAETFAARLAALGGTGAAGGSAPAGGGTPPPF